MSASDSRQTHAQRSVFFPPQQSGERMGASIFLILQVGLSRISLKSMVKDGEVRAFLTALVRDHVDLGDWSARMDFLATYLAEQIDGGLLAKELETMLGCQVIKESKERSVLEDVTSKKNCC